ncbi:copper homeostasis protein CutC [Sinomonas mesophila]|uniref:copper homeostasis protein CutC n=1 Tax=Sinomonas mesophila TaxID=1531955 RepID=UPI001FE48345|nr:copper homeostasis protein CutC [Sinomonas mesophila]
MAGVLRPGPESAPRSLATVGPALEFAVESAAGARVALAAGADRVELCAALAETGGVTPGIGVIEAACAVGIPVHVLVRPRAGGFAYTAEELKGIEADAVAAIRAGAAGVVVGMLSADGGPDAEALGRVATAVRTEDPGAEVTFHRAFDAALAAGALGTDGRAADGLAAEALARIARAGADRVLTSGGAPDCGRGLAGLRRLVGLGRVHAPGLQVMAGGGVTAGLVPELLAAGVHAVHASARGGSGVIDPAVAAGIATAVRGL